MATIRVRIALLVLLAVLACGEGKRIRLKSKARSLLSDVPHACDVGFRTNYTATGNVTTIGGLDCYVSVPSGTNRSANYKYPVVILISDIFGWQMNATRAWSDRLARSGFISVLPDFFRNDSWGPTRNQSQFPAWVAKFPRASVLADINAIQTDLATKGIGGLKVGSFGSQGFCWGGLYSTLLTTGDEPAVAASVTYHASLVTPADMDRINNPIYFIGADPDLDFQFNNTLHQYAVNIVDTKRDEHVDCRIRSYEGLQHGFTLRGDPGNGTVQAGANDAFLRGARYLWRHLHRRTGIVG